MATPNEAHFLAELQAKVYEAATKDLDRNYDADRFGAKPQALLDPIKAFVRRAAHSRGISVRNPREIEDALARLKQTQSNPLELLGTYQLLQDDYSRGVLLELYLQKTLGADRFKLTRNSDKYWFDRDLAYSLSTHRQKIKIKFMDWELSHFDLNKIGFDLNLYQMPLGIDLTFLKKQYEYNKATPPIGVKPGDVVIDAGSCFGDTSLYFASQAGKTGSVFAIEFIPGNLKILRTNFELNPSVASNIEIVERPVWDHSGKTLFTLDNGPGSRVSESPIKGAFEVQTLSIDDLAKERNLDRIDFIKMDIEGAELPALKGAVEVIRKCTPTLAICVYHKPSDWTEIPKFISSLNLGYKMWLDHFTIYPEETVLFCRR